MKKSSSFLSICLTLSVVLGNFSLPVLAYEKSGVNFEQVRAETKLNNSGATLNKINSPSEETKNLSSDSLITKKDKAGLEKSQQIEVKKKDYVEGEILVKYKNTKINLNTVSGRAAALNFTNSKSLEKKEDLRKNNISVLRIKDNKTVEEKIAELKNDPNVEYAQPNYQYYPTDINTNDTNRGLLWGLDNTGQTITGPYGSIDGSYIPTTGTVDKDIDAPEAWAISEATTSAPVIVAIVDTGVAYNHPDLVANMWDGSACVGEDSNGILLGGGCNHGYDYQDNDKTPLPTTSSHGTHIAGTIAAAINNGKGIIGVAPQAKIMAIKSSLTTSNAVKSINFAQQNGAKVINASWGTYSTSGEHYDIALYNAIKDFSGLFVVAAGNANYNHDDGIDTHKSYPDGFKVVTPIGPGLNNIIVVAATDQNDNLASFSDYGATSVDVGAPGTNIYSTVADTVSFSENFETSALHGVGTQFTAGGTTASYWGVEQIGSQKALFTDDYFLPYIPNEYAYIESGNINLTQKTGAKLDFNVWCDTESTPSGSLYDFLGLKIYNGSTWTAVELYHESRIAGWMGSSTLSVNGYPGYLYSDSFNITPYLSTNNKIKFEWSTDTGNIDGNHLGCFIDELKITSYSDGSDNLYAYLNGTSMATPHVAGLAALIEGYNPSLTSSQVKNIILTTGDSLPALTGITTTRKRINAQKALQAANPAKAITAFTVPGQISSVVTEATHIIAISVPFGTNITALVATFTTTGAGVAIGAVPQVSATTPNDFTSPVTYTVTAADSSTQDYIVTVNVPIPVLTSVSVTPPTASVAIGATQQFTATTLDQNGATFVGATTTWLSSNTAVATVSATGLVTGVAAGPATITASSTDGVVKVAGTSTITVTAGGVCVTAADTNTDGAISNIEILNYIKNWKIGTVTNILILRAIGFWKSGVGC